MKTNTIKDNELKKDFIQYLKDNPELRFWQALRNWSSYGFIIASNDLPTDGQDDTFYWEGKK